MNMQECAIDSSSRILRLRQVCMVTGLCRSTIYQMEADLRFPRRIKIGTRAVGWLAREVEAWLIDRIKGTRKPPTVSLNAIWQGDSGGIAYSRASFSRSR